jgi:hypothetical protein
MSKTLPVLTLALMATMLGTTAYASSGLTRAQVRAETLAAIHDGTIINGDGLAERMTLPGLFPPAPAVAHETRAQGNAETLAAIHDGSIINGDGLPERMTLPGLFPPAPVVAHETRAQVEAELAQAIRTGDMPAPGRITMTLRQESPQMYG